MIGIWVDICLFLFSWVVGLGPFSLSTCSSGDSVDVKSYKQRSSLHGITQERVVVGLMVVPMGGEGVTGLGRGGWTLLLRRRGCAKIRKLRGKLEK